VGVESLCCRGSGKTDPGKDEIDERVDCATAGRWRWSRLVEKRTSGLWNATVKSQLLRNERRNAPLRSLAAVAIRQPWMGTDMPLEYV
jgi:hypothetical protein